MITGLKCTWPNAFFRKERVSILVLSSTLSTSSRSSRSRQSLRFTCCSCQPMQPSTSISFNLQPLPRKQQLHHQYPTAGLSLNCSCAMQRPFTKQKTWQSQSLFSFYTAKCSSTLNSVRDSANFPGRWKERPRICTRPPPSRSMFL